MKYLLVLLAGCGLALLVTVIFLVYERLTVKR